VVRGRPGLGENEGVTIYFKKKQRIDRLLIVPADKSGRLVEKVKVSDGQNSVTIDLADAPSSRRWRGPLEGSTYEITIERVGGPNKASDKPGDVACLADAVLLPRQAALRSEDGREAALRRQARQAPRPLERRAMGAPDRELVFALDGTWEWSYKPLLGGKPKKNSGEYRFRGNRLLHAPGRGRALERHAVEGRARPRRQERDRRADRRLRQDQLGEALDTDLAGDYNNAQF